MRFKNLSWGKSLLSGDYTDNAGKKVTGFFENLLPFPGFDNSKTDEDFEQVLIRKNRAAEKAVPEYIDFLNYVEKQGIGASTDGTLSPFFFARRNPLGYLDRHSTMAKAYRHFLKSAKVEDVEKVLSQLKEV